MFRDDQPIAWTFHKNTSRWTFNTLETTDTYVQQPQKEYPGAPYLALPEPKYPSVSLREAISGRFSCRRFTGESVRYEELSTLLHAAYGVQGRIQLGALEFLERPVPSGGGLYPLELYLLVRNTERLDAGIYHYVAVTHGLEQLRSLVLPRPLISYLFMGQHYAADASFILVLAAVVQRSLVKYGDRGYRYILMEAGHVAQNLNLVATALGLGSFNLGGFFDHDLAALIGLDVEEEIPVYGMAAGRYTGSDRAALRMPAE